MDDEARCLVAEKIAKICAARKRYTLQTGKLANDTDVIAFLCDEIEYLRDKIKGKDERIIELVSQCDEIMQEKRRKEVTTEQAADSGIMTIKNATCYQDIVSILLSNGYFVCCHFDDENNGETMTIEYWRG